MTPVSCDYMISFNYDHDKARDVALTFLCYLCNILPYSIFHESTRKRVLSFFVVVPVVFVFDFYNKMVRVFSLKPKRWNQFYNCNNRHGKILICQRLRQVVLRSWLFLWVISLSENVLKSLFNLLLELILSQLIIYCNIIKYCIIFYYVLACHVITLYHITLD